MPEKESIFLSYAHEDLYMAYKIYNDLKNVGLKVWFDKETLLPGQNWKEEVRIGIRNSRYFIALLSANSVSKTGYVHKEIREALEILDEFPATGVFIVPVRVDNCNPDHSRLQELHWVDLFPSYEAGIAKLLRLFNLVKVEENYSLINNLKKQAQGYWKEGKLENVISIYERILEISPNAEIAKQILVAARKLRGFKENINSICARIDMFTSSQTQLLIKNISDGISRRMMDVTIASPLYEWRDGYIRTIDDIKPIATNRAEDWILSDEADKILEPIFNHWLANFNRELAETIAALCQEYGVPKDYIAISTKELFILPSDAVKAGHSNVIFTILGVQVVGIGIGAALVVPIIYSVVGWSLGWIVVEVFALDAWWLMSWPGLAILTFAGGVAIFGGKKVFDIVLEKVASSDLPKQFRKKLTDEKIRSFIKKKEPHFREKLEEAIRTDLGNRVNVKIVDAIKFQLTVQERRFTTLIG